MDFGVGASSGNHRTNALMISTSKPWGRNRADSNSSRTPRLSPFPNPGRAPFAFDGVTVQEDVASRCEG
jgi:hypothetical protein